WQPHTVPRLRQCHLTLVPRYKAVPEQQENAHQPTTRWKQPDSNGNLKYDQWQKPWSAQSDRTPPTPPTSLFLPRERWLLTQRSHNHQEPTRRFQKTLRLIV